MTDMSKSLKDILKRYAHGEASREELEILSAALSSPEGEQTVLEQMDEDLRALEAQHPQPGVEAETDRIYQAISAKIQRRRRRRTLLRAAAVLVPIIIVASLAWWVNARFDLFSSPQYSEIVAENGNCTQVVFQDGTHVWLKGGSKIKYPSKFAWGERRVEIDGEGYFKVEKDSRRPFVVVSPHGEVQVTGTEFNISADAASKQTLVTLYSGSVAFSVGEKKYSLSPGDQLAYSATNGEVSITQPATINDFSIWRHNLLKFNRASLQEVVAQLKEWYGVDFTIADKAALAYTFTYSTEPIPFDSLLSDLELISPLEFRRENQEVKVFVRE